MRFIDRMGFQKWIGKVKAEHEEHHKRNKECIEKFNVLSERMKKIEKICEVLINDPSLRDLSEMVHKYEIKKMT